MSPLFSVWVDPAARFHVQCCSFGVRMQGKAPLAQGSLGVAAAAPPGPAYRGGVPVEAVRAEVGHGGLVAAVRRERGPLGQEPLHLVIGPCEQGDDLSHRLLHDMPAL